MKLSIINFTYRSNGGLRWSAPYAQPVEGSYCATGWDAEMKEVVTVLFGPSLEPTMGDIRAALYHDDFQMNKINVGVYLWESWHRVEVE